MMAAISLRAPASLVCLCLLLGGCGGSASERSGSALAAPRAAGPLAPPLELPDLAGRIVSLEELRGTPVVVNFWATWCGPCQREIPSLRELQERFGKSGLRILAVSIDNNPGALDRFVAEQPLPFTVLRDPDSSVAARFGVTTVPSTFLLDARGHVSERIDGEVDWTRADLLEEVQRLVSEARTGPGKSSG